MPLPQEHLDRQPRATATKPYEIRALPDGRFAVTLKGLLDADIALPEERIFNNKDEAEAAVEHNRASAKEAREFEQYKATFSPYANIKRTATGYDVTAPGLRDEQGAICGFTTTPCETWDAAKKRYLEIQKELESPPDGNILTIDHENVKMGFSSYDRWNPKVTPGEPAFPIPESLKSMLTEEKLNPRGKNNRTWEHTIDDERWTETLFAFITDVMNNEGTDLAQELHVADLRALTPRQAMELATRLVLRFTKYSHGDVIIKGPTRSDATDALTLLKEGRERHDDETWEGNGVCRNFADMTKAVFDALKAQQRPATSQLNNAYTLNEGDLLSFDPRKSRHEKIKNIHKNTDEPHDIEGHAWNSFVVVREQGVQATIADTTWGKYHLDTKNVVNIDHTLTRLEPVAHELGMRAVSPDALQRILTYYAVKMERPGGVDAALIDGELTQANAIAQGRKLLNERGLHDVNDALAEKYGRELHEEMRRIAREERAGDEKQFFVERAWEIIKRHRATDLPKELAQEIEVLMLDANIEILSDTPEHIWEILQRQQSPSCERTVKQLINRILRGNARVLENILQTKNTEFARFVVAEYASNITKAAELSPMLRVLLRKMDREPGLGWRPWENQQHHEELRLLISSSRFARYSPRFRYLTTPEQFRSTIDALRAQVGDTTSDDFTFLASL